MERAYELGAADYISRPFDEVSVCRRVVNTMMLYSKQKRLILHIGIVTEMLLKRLREKTDKYNLTPERISLISKAAAFHDIGKISISEEILNKH